MKWPSTGGVLNSRGTNIRTIVGLIFLLNYSIVLLCLYESYHVTSAW